ncbi:hypothetical protein [Streptomyces vinaceus]|uniref:hypothetical protein n=1 Tax=Streptomyces vinaceus TaxID=1960 RepID=UPI00381DF4C9
MVYAREAAAMTRAAEHYAVVAAGLREGGDFRRALSELAEFPAGVTALPALDYGLLTTTVLPQLSDGLDRCAEPLERCRQGAEPADPASYEVALGQFRFVQETLVAFLVWLQNEVLPWLTQPEFWEQYTGKVRLRVVAEGDSDALRADLSALADRHQRLFEEWNRLLAVTEQGLSEAATVPGAAPTEQGLECSVQRQADQMATWINWMAPPRSAPPRQTMTGAPRASGVAMAVASGAETPPKPKPKPKPEAKAKTEPAPVAEDTRTTRHGRHKEESAASLVGSLLRRSFGRSSGSGKRRTARRGALDDAGVSAVMDFVSSYEKDVFLVRGKVYEHLSGGLDDFYLSQSYKWLHSVRYREKTRPLPARALRSLTRAEFELAQLREHVVALIAVKNSPAVATVLADMGETLRRCNAELRAVGLILSRALPEALSPGGVPLASLEAELRKPPELRNTAWVLDEVRQLVSGAGSFMNTTSVLVKGINMIITSDVFEELTGERGAQPDVDETDCFLPLSRSTRQLSRVAVRLSAQHWPTKPGVIGRTTTWQ